MLLLKMNRGLVSFSHGILLSFLVRLVDAAAAAVVNVAELEAGKFEHGIPRSFLEDEMLEGEKRKDGKYFWLLFLCSRGGRKGF